MNDRVIKFRAWSEKFGGMIYPEDRKYSIDVHAATVWQEGRDDEWVPLMQYTEHKDKNGKEIYEGDIIAWDGHAFMKGNYTIENVHHFFEWCLQNSIDPYLSHVVIGNIYENPELVEAAESNKP